jgi:AAA+ ATPase superfamily predicted ATPase
MPAKEWGFYGRRTELAQVERLLARGAFFFCAISGRRRIGKTSLIQEALKKHKAQKAVYIQIPDSDERGVIQVFEDAIEDTFRNQDFARLACKNFSDIALLIAALWNQGFIVAIDEFQYFHRKALSEFLSHLQKVVDFARSQPNKGGLFALGSIHTEMTAVLEDKNSPLFNRVTDRIEVGHWDFETLFEMFRVHEIISQHHRLFLWSIFEGVPKFYRDCFDHGVLIEQPEYRHATLRRMFFEGSSPLKDEADNWFLRELRGRFDSVLKLVARMGPCSHGTLKAEYARTGPGSDRQLGGYLAVLIERYRMIERISPIMAEAQERKSRYVITDNFLMAWLSSIARNVQLARIRPIDEAVTRADEALQTHEGYTFEKLVRIALEECSRKKVGDFSLTKIVRGYWNKADGSDIEIDVVAINDEARMLRLGSCKRSAAKHNAESLKIFSEHVDRFLQTKVGKRFSEWKIERAVYSPSFSQEQRTRLVEMGYICTDMNDFEKWLSPDASLDLFERRPDTAK